MAKPLAWPLPTLNPINMRHFSLFLSLAICLVLTACTDTNSNVQDSPTNTAEANTEATAQFVKQSKLEPLEGAAKPFTTFTVKSDQTTKLNTPTGTQITVPAGAFVFADGSAVTEEVNLQFREFHSAAEIMLSGISMWDWSEDEAWETMQSAGMFEMRASTNDGTLVDLANGVTIDVALASNVEGTYDYWYFDEAAGDWQNEGQNTAVPMPADRLSENVVTSPTPAPTKPVQFDPNQYAVDFIADYKKFPALAEYEDVVFQYSGTPGSEDDPAENEWIFDQRWDIYDLQATKESKVYLLKLENDDNEFTTKVRATLRGDEYRTALADYQRELATFQANVAQMEAQRIQNTRFMRAMAVSRMGVYNYDIYSRWEEPVFAEVDFTLPSKVQGHDLTAVYLVTDDGAISVNYPAYNYDKFNFDRQRNNLVVGMLSDRSLVVVEMQDFADQTQELVTASASKQGQSLLLSLAETDYVIDDADALQSALEELLTL